MINSKEDLKRHINTLQCLWGGLKINHYGLIIINSKAQIGEWCDIHQGVNIGENLEPGSVPQIGNNVWVGNVREAV